MIRLSDLCSGHDVCCDPFCGDANENCDGCSELRCSCGLPWDPDRGPHTTRGLLLTPDVVARILAREGQAYEAAEALARLRFVRRAP